MTGFAYLIASVLFIMALRGLSSPESARQGNMFGITGMVIAILTALSDPSVVSFSMILVGMLIGGFIGTVVALRIQMTALPQLVAAFHSLVGLAAVFVAGAAFYNPEAYNIGTPGDIYTGSIIEMSLGLIIGAITFSGSVIAFAKLQGMMSGNPITFRLQHPLNGLIAGLIVLTMLMLISGQTPGTFWTLAGLSFLLGFLLIIPIGGADMPVVVSMLNSYSGWAACGIGFTLSNPALIITGALVGSSGAILNIPYEAKILSAHRNPELVNDYSKTARDRGLKVIIAGAGMAAALPGVIAALTPLPVLGVPMETKVMGGMDSLLSMAQMPGGVPVGTLAIGKAGAKNAALLAGAILALSDEKIAQAVDDFRKMQNDTIADNPSK